MRSLAAFLALSMALGAPGPAAYQAFAADVRAGGSRAPSEGAWSVYFSGRPLAAVPFLPHLGLNFSQGRTLQAFIQVLENTKAKPEAVLAQDSPIAQAAMIREAVGKYADALMQQSFIASMYRMQGSQSQHPTQLVVGPWAMSLMDKEFRDLRDIIGIFPQDQGLEILDNAQEIHQILSAMRLERAIRKVQALDRLWAPPDADSVAAWRGFEAILQNLAPSAAQDHRLLLDSVMQGKEEMLAAAAGSPALTRPQRWVADPILAGQARRVRSWRWMLATDSSAPEAALSRLASGRPLAEGERDLLKDLKPYVPGINPNLAVANAPAFERRFSDGSVVPGWVVPLWTHGPSPKSANLMVLSGGASLAERVHAAAHEGFHQGDREYTRTILVLQLLLGPQGGAELAHILIEGFTEYRTRVAMLRLLRDGYAGKSPFAKSFADSVRKLLKAKSQEDAEDKLHKFFKPQPYTPFVKLVEAMRWHMAEPAIEAFVQWGDARLLVSSLGEERLRLLGAISALYLGYSSSEDEHPPSARTRIAEASGLSAWLVGKMQEVVAGRLKDTHEVDELEIVAEEFLAVAGRLLERQPRSQQMLLLRALKDADFDGYLTLIHDGQQAQLPARMAADLKARIAQLRPAARAMLWGSRLRRAILPAVAALAAFFLEGLAVHDADWAQHLPIWVRLGLAFTFAGVFFHLYRAYVAAMRNLPILFHYLPFSPGESARLQQQTR